MEEAPSIESKLDNEVDIKEIKYNGTDVNYLIENFSSDVRSVINDRNTSRLKDLYDMLSEVDDVDKGKTACLCLYNDCFEDMMKVVKSDDNSNTLKYHVWHFLQLMTCCAEAKQKLYADKDAIPQLLALEECGWTNDELLSLKSISLNYILAMLANASDDYYEYIASTEVIPYFYGLLVTCELKPDDSFVELLLLGLNLVLEGSCFCKQQLLDLDFKSLLSKKIDGRENCSAKLLYVAKQTYEKFVLLGSEHKSYVETFRYDFKEEVKKNSLYSSLTCHNSSCKNTNDSDADTVEAASFKRCSRCKTATYCSKECQVEHWKGSHSKNCSATT